MDMNKLEEKLDDLVTEARDAGMPWDEIISAFELKVMALNEEAGD
jgi:hypothetical protein